MRPPPRARWPIRRRFSPWVDGYTCPLSASSAPDEVLAHVFPGPLRESELFGVITVDVEAELAKLDAAGWRPLRPVEQTLQPRWR